jgi:hypothetical protein
MEELTATISPMQTRDKRMLLPHFAGFFEGEGTIYVASPKKHANGKREFSIQVFLTNTSLEKLQQFQKVFNGHIRRMKDMPGRKPLYRLEWWGANADEILGLLLEDPAFLIKRRQAELARRYRRIKPPKKPGQTGYSKEVVEQLRRIAEEIHFLNRRGVLAVAETKPLTPVVAN